MGVGLDIGSTTAKGVLIDSTGRVIASHLQMTGASAPRSVESILSALKETSDLDLFDIPTISTGYGRNIVEIATDTVTEITCHAVGISRLNPEIRFIVDVGGQDSKVMRLGSNGRPADFELNDKCSAGTGRFLEVMARVLEVSIEELGPLALESQAPCTISSTCTVFAESEVVGRIGAGETPTDIAAGVHLAMASKIGSLARRVGIKEPICITGGVAKNPAFRHYLSKELGGELWVPENPQLTGALGAAYLALERH
ncbi:MAG: 2-hydroxyglutaryl-CoA dehydratase [Candidatus Thorarchaeota archaeon]|nr:MAG: 2-hydroxyglutaryl-CoA dehydratase [Candidatus Thorarchaeota archaeon]